jgi:hypothetical protein
MKQSLYKTWSSLLSSVAVAGALFAEAKPAIPNWTVPPYRSQSVSGDSQPVDDISDPSLFIAVIPCRMVDTRRTDFPPGYGIPSLGAGIPRDFDLDSDQQCIGIPQRVAAYSLNITVTNTQGPGFIVIWPTGQFQPNVSTLNYLAGQTIANAAIVPAGDFGNVTVVAGVSGADLIIDINGYFLDSGTELGQGREILLRGNVPFPFLTVFNDNSTNSGGLVNAIRGAMVSNRDFVAAIRGEMNSTSGSNYGVTAVTGSVAENAAGLRAHDGGGPLFGVYTTAGVRGESAGTANFGVLGLSRAIGIGGFRVNVSHQVVSGGDLGLTDTVGVHSLGDITATGAKAFVEPHPTDATKMIRYISLEGNEAGTYFRGRGKFQNGLAVIEVPEDFRIVTDPEGLTVQVTPIGAMASVGVIRIGLDRIVVQSSRDVQFSYMVNGIRQAYRDYGPIAENERHFVPESPDRTIPVYLPEAFRNRLISNGTYRPDGTVNMETARRLGWDKVWEQGSRPAPQPAEP